MGLKETNELLAAISRTQAKFLDGVDAGEVFASLLDDFIILSGSEFGFIGQVQTDDAGNPSLKIDAISDMGWNSHISDPPDLGKAVGLEFYSFNNLFGEVVTTESPVISNAPLHDRRSSGLPEGHPNLKTFMGVPVRSGAEMVGMIGVANRQDGYEPGLVEFLQPLLDAYGHIIALMRANKQRSALQTRLSAIVETAADAIVVINCEGIVISANPAVENIFGYRPEQVLGHNVSMLMFGTNESSHNAYLEQYLKTGEKNIIGVGRELKGLKTNGDVFPLHLSVSEFEVDGERFFTGVVRDISELKKMEDTSRRLEQTLDQVYDSVFIFDPESLCFNYVNEGAVRQVGYSKQELYDMTLLDINPSCSEESFREMVEPLLRRNKDSLTFITEHKSKDGENIPVEIQLQYIAAGNGAPRFVSIVRDIRDRIEKEQALRESDERLRRSQYFANVGTWDWNIKTGDLYWSERIAPLFGYREGELETTYENFVNAVHPDDRQSVIDAVNACVEKGQEYNIQHRCVWPDGTERWMLERGDVTRDSNGEPMHMLGVVQDITELKKAQFDLLNAKEDAERANRAKSDFLSRMSHELRTPLNAIMGFAQLFEYDKTASTQHKETATEIYQAGKHLRTLIDDVLDLAKIEAEHVDVVLEPLALTQVVEQCSNLIQPLVEKRGVTLEIEINQCSEIYVLADQTRLKQVLLNLLSNAVKYNREHGIVTLSCEKLAEDKVRFNVSDTGMGISEQDLEHLFKPFSRLVNELSDVEGSGIGLCITKQFVELMQGRIGVESQPGRGSNFWIDLEVADTPVVAELLKQEAQEQRVAVEMSDSLMKKVSEAKILVVEDNPTNRMVFESQLSTLGFHAEVVEGPEKVLGTLDQVPYDLILTDIHMPGMDGYDFVRYLRELEQRIGKRTPVIAVSANVMTGERERCLAAGMDDSISKPVDIDELKETILHWLSLDERTPEHQRDDSQVVPIVPTASLCLNIDRLSTLVGGDVKQQLAIINNFVENVPESVTEIQCAYKKSDAEQLNFWAHRFKSSASAIGAESLARMCKSIEGLAGQKSWSAIAPLMTEFDGLVEKTLDALGEARIGLENDEVESSTADAEIQHQIGAALVVDDDPVVLNTVTAALKNLGVSSVFAASSGQEALSIMASYWSEIDVVLCDLKMPEMDGVEYLRHLVSRDYKGAVILLSGEDNRVLGAARQLADAHSFGFVEAMQKPIEQVQLANVLAKVSNKKAPFARPAQSEITLEELKQAIIEDQFIVYYQPKIDAFSRQLVGVESLIRWQHPEKNFIMPDQFIPLAEENGLIDEVTDLVLNKAFCQLKQWRHSGLDISVSVNIAVGTIGRHIDFPERVLGFLDQHRLEPQDVILELTEGGLMKDIATTLDALVRLRLKGVTLSIDDFGTGYSTFRQLQGIPFAELKIDKEFVMNAVSDPASRAILESSVVLGQKLGMKLVAEGVETMEDWTLLKKLGCHMVQGYYVSRPLPSDELLEWLNDWQAKNGMPALKANP